MSPLEKAAREACERRIRNARRWDTAPGLLEEILPKAVEANWRDELPEIRAVIASIEPDDAMVQLAVDTYWDADTASGPPSMRAALKAGLRALLAEVEGR